MGVLQARRGVDFAKEPVGAEGGGYLWPKDLDGDLAGMSNILSEVDCRPASSSDLPVDCIAAR